MTHKIVYFPLIRTEQQLFDVLSRAAWFLTFSSSARITIPIASAHLADLDWRVAPGMDPTIAARFPTLRQMVTFVVTSTEADLDSHMRSASMILRWQQDVKPGFIGAERFAAWEKGKRVFKVDPVATRQEGAYYLEAGLRLMENKAKVVAESRAKFNGLRQRLGRYEQAFVLATGPSVSNYARFDYKDALGIVCNSVILDDALMETVKPKILVFADPIFHFGPSQYAATFREGVREAAKKTDFMICTPLKYYAVFTAAIPELADRTIAIPFRKDREFNFDLASDFELKTTANVLTFVMLPLATTFARKVAILGCDGRPLQENTYFWNHNPATQINDKMANIREVHPGFFDIDYNDYYLEHCRTLEEQIECGERSGWHFESLADSYIPVLKARYAAVGHTRRMTSGGERDKADGLVSWPRLLVIDSTRVGALNATGQLKKKILAGWPKDQFLQVCAAGRERYCVAWSIEDNTTDAVFSDEKPLFNVIASFDPQVVYYRPLIDQHPRLHALATKILERHPVPLVTHIMDDWPSRLAARDPAKAQAVDRSLRQLFARSDKVLSICEKMSDGFGERYGVEFEAIGNGVDLDLYSRARAASRSQNDQRREIVLRYCGALAKDMTFQTILDIARAVDDLQNVIPIRLEVYALRWWFHDFKNETEGLRGVTVLDSVSEEDYPRLLSGADVLVLGYNFDEESLRYIRYSMPNKLPEYLGSGRPILAVGPLEAAGIEYLFVRRLACCVTARDPKALTAALQRIATDARYRNELGEKGKNWARERFDIKKIVTRFQQLLRLASETYSGSEVTAPSRTQVVGQPSNVVLVFYPTLRTQAELKFWRLLVERLKKRGYRAVIVSFLRTNWQDQLHESQPVGCERIFVPSEVRMIMHMPEFIECDKFPDTNPLGEEWWHQRAMDALVESLSVRGKDDKEVCRGGGVYVRYLLRIIRTLSPAKVIVNNDTLPIHYIARCCAEAVGVPVIHSERSPTVSQWFEPDGFYAKSEAGRFLDNVPWDRPGPHESRGRVIVEDMRRAPAGHRSSTEVHVGAHTREAREMNGQRRRRFLLPMDHVHATGWTQRSHPLRQVNYPLFGSPEEAISKLADIARQFEADLIVKPHPADQYISRLRLPDGVDLFEGDIGDAMKDADVLLCFLTKVAVAALAWGKPVVTLAPNVAALSGVTFDCKSVGAIERQIERALTYSPTDEHITRVCRFLGYLDQHYFVANDLDNEGSNRLLEEHFPMLHEIDSRHREANQAIEIGDSPLIGLDVMAPDAPTADERNRDVQILYGPFGRSRNRQIEEVDVVAELFQRRVIETGATQPLMIDVGACKGSAFQSFVQNGWMVHAFEPNPPMYKNMRKIMRSSNVVLNQLAVSDRTGETVPFYTSEESIGISSMLAFRESHRQTATVETVRLDDYCSEHRIDAIDFLKIDTEGYDLMVMKGLDWGKIRPRAVICEFEDAKTKALGYRFEELVRFLDARGYQVFVSEWHPITRYGSGEHRWRAMHKWPTQLIDQNAWGNLIAFREPVPDEMMRLVTRHAVDRQSLRRAETARQKELKDKAQTSNVALLRVDAGYPEFGRDAHARIDEAKLVSVLFDGSNSSERIMLDVGAHVGSSTAHFAVKGWRIYCFEPDLSNHKKLAARFSKATNVVVDSRAVGERAQKNRPFFTSPQSSGISGLTAFHETHTHSGVVDVTTVSEIVDEHNLDRIDFLKIDAEGFDFYVLRGVPWNRIRPSVIECEFEDAKTVPCGHNWRDIAEFLVAKSYTVYVSEWHPIIRYGISHDWFGIKRYPCSLEDDKAWGNLLAFLEDPGPGAIEAALKKCVSVEKLAAVSKASSVAQPQQPTGTKNTGNKSTPEARAPMNVVSSSSMRRSAVSFSVATKLRGWAKRRYAAYASAVKGRSLVLFRAGQAVAWSLRAIHRRPRVAVAALVAIAALLAAPLHVALWPYRAVFWAAALLSMLVFGGAVTVAVTNEAVRRLLASLRAEADSRVRVAQQASDRRVLALEKRVASIAKQAEEKSLGLEARLAALTKEVASISQGLESKIGTLTKKLANISSGIDSRVVSLEKQAEEKSLGLETRLAALTKEVASISSDLEAQVASLGKQAEETLAGLKADIASLSKETASVSAGLANAEAMVGGIGDKLDKLKVQGDETVKRIGTLAARVEEDTAYQRFNRVLTPVHVETLQNVWSKRLGVKVTKPGVAYMAHIIRTTEQNALGRLATSIEDAMLRILVSSSVRAKKLDVLEIGTLFGIGLSMIYEYNRGRYESVHITAIDPLDGYYKEKELDVLLNIPISKATFWRNLRLAGVSDGDVTLIDAMSTSDEAIERANVNKYDVLIIDGDHSYAGVKADFENYVAMVRRGGFIVFDDYGAGDWPDVQRFVDSEVSPDSRVVLVGLEWRTAVFRVVKPSVTSRQGIRKTKTGSI